MDLSFQFWLEYEARPGHGEDTVVCGLRQTDGGTAGLTACLDGCGGAGAHEYPQAEGWTGARIGSRIAGNVLSDWFENGAAQDALKGALTAALREALPLLGDDSTLVSPMVRVLPTTLSAVVSEPFASDVRLTFHWAGDSRGYVLTPGNGLRQITRDDLDGGEEGELLNDGVLNNIVSARSPYFIHTETVVMQVPFLAVAASDGCFNYFREPMLFEAMLYDTLAAAEGPLDWKTRIEGELRAIAGDDCTMAVIAYGFGDFPSLQRVFAARRREFSEQFAAPVLQLLKQGDAEGLDRLRGAYLSSYFGGGV